MKKWWNKMSDAERISASLLIFATTLTIVDIVLIVIGTINIIAKTR